MKKLLGFLLVNLSCTLLLQATNSDWPFVNLDQQNSRANLHEQFVTVSNASHLSTNSPGWQFNLPSAGVQVAPIVSNGLVYFGDQFGNFYQFNITTGLPQTPAVSFPGSAIDAPATIVGDVAYITTVPSGTSNSILLHALNTSTWTEINSAFPIQLETHMPFADGINADVLSGVVVVDNIAIVGLTNNGLEEVTNPNLVFRGGFLAFNATTGAFLWSFVVNEPPLGIAGGSWSTAAVDQNLKMMFVGTTNANTPQAGPLTDALLALNYTTGQLIWHYQYTENDVFGAFYSCGRDWDLGASPNLFTMTNKFGKQVNVVGACNKEGIYRVFERSTGNPEWSTATLPEDAVPSSDGNPTATFANGTVYVLSGQDTSGESTGALTAAALLCLDPTSPCFNPAFFEEVTNILSKKITTFITALNANTGKILWQSSFIGNTTASITYANGLLYVGDFNGVLRIFNANNGTAVTTFQLPVTIGAPVTVVDFGSHPYVLTSFGIQPGVVGGVWAFSF